MAVSPARPAHGEDHRSEVELPDSVELYLNEIARFKLLTPQEEIDLFKRVENGRVLNQLSELHMAETGSPPTNEQLTFLVLREMARALQLFRDTPRAVKGFPQNGDVGEELQSEKLALAIQHGIDPKIERKLHLSSKISVARAHDLIVALAAGIRMYGPEPPQNLERALRLIGRGSTPNNQKLMMLLKSLTAQIRRARDEAARAEE